jgi:hypothetical protein
MNFRLTAIIFGVVLVLVATLLVFVLVDSDQETVDAESGLLAPLVRAGLKAKDIDTVELTRAEPAEETLTFVKTAAGKWELSRPFRARADAFAVEDVVNTLFQAKPTPYEELTSSLAVHELDRPAVKITLKSGEKSATVTIGRTTIGGERAVTFVTTSSAPDKPLAVRHSDLSGVFRDSSRGKDGPAWQLVKWLPDYRPRRLLAADARDPASELQVVKITTGGKELALQRSPGGVWTFTTPAGWGEADDLGETSAQPGTAPITGVRPLLNSLTGLQAGPDDYIEKPGDLAPFGLKPDSPGAVRVELKGKDGEPEVIWLGQPVRDKENKPVVPPQVYARLEGDPAVVKVQTERVDAIRATVANPGELRNKDLLPPAKRDRIDAIDLVVGNSTVKLRKTTGAEGPRWQLLGGPGDPQDAKAIEVNGFLTELTRPRAAKEVLSEKNDAAFASPGVQATIRVWFDGIDKAEKVEPGKPAPEPKLKGTPTELVFGKTEGDAVLVRRTADGTTIDLKVPAALLSKATKTRLDFIDPKLKSFDTQKVERFVFNRGKEEYEIHKGAGTIPWTFAKPESRKTQSADPVKVFGMLGQLSVLPVERVVAEQPAVEELKKWGLDPAAPRLKLTLTLGDPADKERVYLFGNDVEGVKSVYAQQVGRPFVLQVSKGLFDRLATDDLRDMTLYRVEPVKVKRLKIRGWKGPQTYQFEKQGAGWVAVEPTPKDFGPDSSKLSALLGTLIAPRATAFVDIALKPQYGLDPQNPDWIEFTIEQDGAPPVTLVLGAKADGGLVYGMSSGVPGEIFTIDPTLIRRYTDKPETLKK